MYSEEQYRKALEAYEETLSVTRTMRCWVSFTPPDAI